MKVFETKKEAINFLTQNGANKKHIQEIVNYGVTKLNDIVVIVDEMSIL